MGRPPAVGRGRAVANRHAGGADVVRTGSGETSWSLVAENDVAALVACIRTNLDCADICNATLRVLSRQTAYDAATTRARAGSLRPGVQLLR
ncbi:MAG TPA: hypothetical protein VFZ70_17750 [Euzebyales bacterium]